ncbi:MAG: hypothetical protein GX991_02610 [Clostridiaceae bacterium]|nr:hypothetical protein [Clostridiaceae bacterium]
MKYLVLETHIKYAIVLDEEGRFLRVVNNAYTVGQKIDKVTIYHDFKKARTSRQVWIQRISVVAACLIIAFISYFQIFLRPVAAMRLSVNPAFRIEWNRLQKVTGVQAENAGAMIILENYSWKQKSPTTVVRELIGLCNLKGYLKGEKTVTIKMEPGDKNATKKVWDELQTKLSFQLSYIDQLTLKFEDDSQHDLTPPTSSQPDETTMPTSAGDPSSTTRPSSSATRPDGTPIVDDSDYDESDYDDSDYDDNGYNDDDDDDDNDDIDDIDDDDDNNDDDDGDDDDSDYSDDDDDGDDDSDYSDDDDDDDDDDSDDDSD